MAPVTFDQFVRIAWAYAAQAYPAELGWACSSRVPSGAEEWFCEYVWCVFCAGFSARVLSRRWGAVWDAYRGFSLEGTVDRETVLRVFGNTRKVDATLRVREMLRATPWPEFRARYLTSLDTMQELPYIGPVLARHSVFGTRRRCARRGRGYWANRWAPWITPCGGTVPTTGTRRVGPPDTGSPVKRPGISALAAAACRSCTERGRPPDS